MTAMVVALLLRPLLRVQAPGRTASQSDGEEELAVYEGQLADIERDLAAGTLPAEAAAELRLDKERRLLAADAARRSAVDQGRPARKLAIAVLVFVLVAGPSLYLVLGSPEEPAQPHAEREEVQMHRALQERAAGLRADLAANPDNPDGWQELAIMRTMLGHPGAAADAYRQALAKGGDSASLYAALAEALIAQAQGTVTLEARRALSGAMERDPNDPLALYYVGHALEQDQRYRLALTLWQDMASALPEDSRWQQRLRADIARVAPKAEASQE
ncbi:MAG: hypothetical protein Kilf2KO_43980 [Rhodospirillales bacterium]